MTGFTASAWSCTVRLVVDDERTLRAASQDLMILLDRVDRVASRFRPDSALSLANAGAGRPTPVPQLLVELVGAALDAAARTGGLVDPTVGLAMHNIGYDRDISDLVGRDVVSRATASPRSRAMWSDVRLHREAGLLTVPVGTTLDLGATAKAWVADLAAQTLSRRYERAVLVELGGDLAVAGDAPDGWCIDVAEQAGASGQLVTITRGGLATSTTTLRRWHLDGRPVHHVIDPRTGRPVAGPWRTASVYAPSAYEANVASTAAIVLGTDALDWLATRSIAARLVDQDGAVEVTAGWPIDAALAGAR